MRQTLRAWRAPDVVIGARVVLAFVAIGLFSLPFPWTGAALALTVVVISMDALDGWLARRLGLTSDLGSVLDITGDRIVEHVFWIYFAVVHRIPLWIPVVVVTRSFVVDTVRAMALRQGMTAFGEKSMMRGSVSRFLVSSRFMRSAYGFAKVASFVLLGAVVVSGEAVLAGAMDPTSGPATLLEPVTWVIVLVTVVLNVARGAPVVWDARPFLRHDPAPRG